MMHGVFFFIGDIDASLQVVPNSEASLAILRGIDPCHHVDP